MTFSTTVNCQLLFGDPEVDDFRLEIEISNVIKQQKVAI